MPLKSKSSGTSLNLLELENKWEPQILGLQIWTAKQLQLKSAGVFAVKPQRFKFYMDL